MKRKLLISAALTTTILSAQPVMAGFLMFNEDAVEAEEATKKSRIHEITDSRVSDTNDGVEMNISGSPFSNGSAVLFDGQPIQTDNKHGDLSAKFPIRPPGETVSVEVINPDGDIVAKAPYTYPPRPSIESIEDGITGPSVEGRRFFKLNGNNLSAGTQFTLNGYKPGELGSPLIKVHYRDTHLPHSVVVEVEGSLPEGPIELDAENSLWEKLTEADPVTLDYRYEESVRLLPDFYWMDDSDNPQKHATPIAACRNTTGFEDTAIAVIASGGASAECHLTNHYLGQRDVHRHECPAHQPRLIDGQCSTDRYYKEDHWSVKHLSSSFMEACEFYLSDKQHLTNPWIDGVIEHEDNIHIFADCKATGGPYPRVAKLVSRRCPTDKPYLHENECVSGN